MQLQEEKQKTKYIIKLKKNDDYNDMRSINVYYKVAINDSRTWEEI